MKFAVYVRVSRGDLNTDNQKLAILDYCKAKGWEYQVFEEVESTRKTRPVKEEVLAKLRKGEFDGVVVYKLDRWARSLQELIMNVTEITNRGKQFVAVTQPFDTTSAAGMLMMQILGAFAEFEREIIRERTMAGLDRARAKGIKLGRPKLGAGKRAAPIEAVKNLLAQAKTEREIAKILETSRYKVQKAIELIKVENAGEGLNGQGLVELTPD